MKKTLLSIVLTFAGAYPAVGANASSTCAALVASRARTAAEERNQRPG